MVELKNHSHHILTAKALKEDITAIHSPTHNALCGAALETHTP